MGTLENSNACSLEGMNRRVILHPPGKAMNVDTPAAPRVLAPTLPETGMTPDAILALYSWVIGTCFRCAETDLFVTPVGSISTPRGERYNLAACGCCILTLENERRRFAEKRGLRYRPGSLGS
jgi:hypothetical protein